MTQSLSGYLVEFDSADDLLDGLDTLRDRGYRQLEAYTPFPLDGLEDRLPPVSNPVPLVMLLAGLAGGLLGYGIQYYTAVLDYPILAGGKPMHSWPAFLLVAFELTVLCSAVAGFLCAIASSGLPRLHHPLFEIPAFRRASRDRFFLLIDAVDERFEHSRTRREAASLEGASVHPVPASEEAG